MFILAESFINIYNNMKGTNLEISNRQELEETLFNFLVLTIGYKHDYINNMKEVEIYFETIINNVDKYHTTLIDGIKQYTKEYMDLLESHPLTQIFIQAVNNLYSNSFNIKDVEAQKSKETNIAIRQINNQLEIIRAPRIDENNMPIMIIKDIDNFEELLRKYLESIKESNTYYNIFARKDFQIMSENEKINMVLAGTCLNLSLSQAVNLEDFIEMYTDFINDKTLSQFNYPTFINPLFGDELYIMAKRSELWYETPYYLSFMLKNKRIELPNIRMGISRDSNDKQVANIIATQTAQKIFNEEDYEEIEAELKKFIPKDNYFRFHNPTHLVSLVLTFGLLKGLGIEDVKVTDYMPFRYKKVQIDKQLNEEEAANYQTRLTTKNLATYMNLINTLTGIEIINYPDDGHELTLKITDNVEGKNAFFSYLYKIGYKFGEEHKNIEAKQK